jgi:succinate-acetate transporter protein
VTRVVLRPVASRTPLAFFAFGMGTILYTGAPLHRVPPTQGTILGIVLVAFVGPLELIAGLIAYAPVTAASPRRCR